MIRRQNNNRHRIERGSSPNLIAAAIHVDPFKSRIQCNAFAFVALNQLPLYRPLFEGFCILKPFAQRVDEDETGYLLRVNARVKSND